MKYLVFYIALLFYSLSFSQQKIIDSLVLQLEQNVKPNTNRLHILNELGYYYSQVNPEKGIRVTNKAIDLAKQLSHSIELANAYKYQGINYSVMSQDSLALLMYDKSIKIQSDLKDNLGVAKTIYNKGLIYFKQSDFNLANTCNLQAYEIFEKEKDSFLMAKMLNSIGLNYMYKSQYLEALDTYLKASNIYEALSMTKDLQYAATLTNIGLLYNRLEKHDLALNYQKKSLQINRDIDYPEGIANNLINLGNTYDNKKDSKKAIEYYQKSHIIMKRIGNKTGIASALANTGIAYVSLKNYSKALEYLNQTKIIYKELGNITNLAIVHNNIGKCFLESSNKKKTLLKARRNFNEAYNYSKQIKDLKSQAKSLNNLALVNSKLKNYKEAYQIKTEAIKVRDSFFSSEKKEEIAKLEAKYTYEKKEAILKANYDKEQALTEAEITRQKLIKNTSIIGGSSLVLASLIGFILYRRKQEALTKTKEAEFNAKVSDTELKALRAQMNPHFIFNSLNSIDAYILKNDTKSASDYLTKFAKLMRQTLENSEKKEVLLKEDISLLKTYLEIEKKRFNNNFTYEVKIDNTIDTENTLVPPMILQPFIENSIIHGISTQEKGHIIIEIKKENNMIICSVDDNGIGRQKSLETSSLKNKQSLGMKITKSRIDIINKLNNTDGKVAIIDKEKGTRIEVSLPIQLAF
jgi:tetratricopeptide (TPR) repeat protein